MDTNRETILDELIDFDKKRPNDISTILENYLSQIAKTGDPMFPWNKLKPLIRQKLEIVISEFYEACPTDTLPPLPNVDNFKYDDLRCKILEAVDTFPNAPFTIQRLCELLTSPKKHYQRTDKFMRGLEKNILVVSTVEPRSTEHSEVNNNNNLIMNGIIESSAVADMLSAENINLTSRAVMNGTPPPLSDNYHSDFPSENGSIDAAVDSESSSSSDSDSSSDSLPPDYVIKDNQMDSVVDSTSTLQVESAMDTSPDNMERNEQEEPEEVVSSSSGLEETDIPQDEGMNPEDDVGSLIADSTPCQPSTEGKEDDGTDETTSPQSSDCHIESASKVDDEEEEEEESEETEEPPSEPERSDSPTKEIPIEEVAESLSEALEPEPSSPPPPPLREPIEDEEDIVEKADVESSSEADAKPEQLQEKAVEMDHTSEPQQSDEPLEQVEKQAPDKTEPMDED